MEENKRYIILSAYIQAFNMILRDPGMRAKIDTYGYEKAIESNINYYTNELISEITKINKKED